VYVWSEKEVPFNKLEQIEKDTEIVLFIINVQECECRPKELRKKN
jgi:hypothetical protein